jgi:hypothetical protein
MQCDHKQRLAARRTQGCEPELRFVACVSGKQEFIRTDTHGVRPRRIVEAQKTVRKSAFGGKLGGNGGDVATGALHPAGRKKFRK